VLRQFLLRRIERSLSDRLRTLGGCDACACVAQLRELARDLLDLRLEAPIQIGENFAGPQAMAAAIAAHAADYMMPDLERIGGVTGWQQAAALAAAAGIEMSSHLCPEASAHLLAATPTVHWLEYVDWADPILAAPLRIGGGCAQIADTRGTGVVWNDEAVARYRLS